MEDSGNQILRSFLEITHQQDEGVAREILERHHWNLEAATNHYFSSNLPTEPNQVPESTESSWSVLGLLSYGVSTIASITSALTGFVWNFFGSQTSQEEPAESFQTRVRGSQLNFSSSSFRGVLRGAKNSGRPLLVYLETPQSSAFFQEVLCSEIATGLINQNFLLWGEDANSHEGRQALQCIGSSEPFLAVLVVENIEAPGVVGTLRCPCGFPALVEFLDRNLLQFQSLRNPTPAFDHDRLIRQRQEEELKEAERIMLEKQQAEKERQQQLLQQQLLEQQKLQEKQNYIQSKLEELGEEPSASPETVHISLRLPSGSKLDRRFLKDHKVQKLYDFVETLDLGLEYEIVTPFPITPLKDLESTLEEQGLYPKALLHVKEVISS